HPFNVITADLTLDPQFLVQKLDFFAELLQPDYSVPSRFITTVKTGKKMDIATIFSEIEQKLLELFPDASYQWLESLPNKKEQIFLVILR
ncbi:MAG: hypothetical protein ACFFDT_12410, partial [Candidatus Hodarchaeota archaeon]